MVRQKKLMYDLNINFLLLYFLISFQITKHIHNEDGNVTSSTKTVEIPIKPGWKAGTKITYQKEG